MDIKSLFSEKLLPLNKKRSQYHVSPAGGSSTLILNEENIYPRSPVQKKDDEDRNRFPRSLAERKDDEDQNSFPRSPGEKRYDEDQKNCHRSPADQRKDDDNQNNCFRSPAERKDNEDLYTYLRILTKIVKIQEKKKSKKENSCQDLSEHL